MARDPKTTPYHEKYSSEKHTLGLKFTDLADGEELESPSSSVDPSGLTVGTPSLNTEKNTLIFTVEAGTAGTVYIVTLKSNLNTGDKVEKRYIIYVKPE